MFHGMVKEILKNDQRHSTNQRPEIQISIFHGVLVGQSGVGYEAQGKCGVKENGI